MSDASQWSPSEYIDATRYGDIVGPAASLIRYVVGNYGSGDVKQTARVLVEVTDLSNLVNDKFGLKDKSIDHEEVEKFLLVAEHLNLVTNNGSYVCGFALDTLFQTIKVIFGENLEEFAAGKPLHDHNLHLFLLHYGKQALYKCSRKILGEKIEQPRVYQFTMDKIVSKDAEILGNSSDETLLEMARDLDLLRGEHDEKAMLDAVEYGGRSNSNVNYKAQPHQRLFEHLLHNCSMIEYEYGKRIEVLNWVILLIPEELQNLTPDTESLKLREYMRICKPVKNQAKVGTRKKNIKRYMSSFFRGLNFLT